MRRRLLKSEFFNRLTLDVAHDLVGKKLVRRDGVKLISSVISEVEAYDGPEDKASHASKGITPRTAVMFGPPGHWYVYLVYGMYWMVNIVTGEEGYLAAILLRGTLDVSGPGKLTRYFGITKEFNERIADEGTGLWIEDAGMCVSEENIIRMPRIGVGYAGEEWAEKPYRFALKIV